ncbi:MAG: glutathione S-transferase family protein [Pigmentiphaga sp.]|uniref:glutathione S-transferase family protein n=1 Tax=Pigmentiphaga sp. TaxID=1977564 RepID=UPI0029BA3951|nr:glutathione S-transferase family protein [Pigmentiphaga sp.]MDX3904947.1 glutathione S-transferase family protein [Pigmentiphaga sp.]
MKLIGLPPSPYTARVLLFARIKGIDLPRESPPGGLRSPEFKALNPIGKVPVLQTDDGQVLPESSVICDYLEDLGAGRTGLPGGPLDKARARLIARVYDLYAAPHSTVLMRQVGEADADLNARSSALAGLAAGLAHVERLLAASPYAAGDLPSLADCALLPPVVQLKRVAVPMFGLQDPTAGTGKFAQWWRAMEADALFSAFAAEYDQAVQSLVEKRLAGT